MTNIQWNNKTVLVLGGAAVIGVYLLYTSGKRAAAAVGEAVNPVSDQNIFYRGVNAIVDVFDDGTKNESNTLGTWLYDLLHEG